MIKKSKIIIIACVALIAMMICLLPFGLAIHTDAQLSYFGSWLNNVIKTEGEFPQSFQSLIEKGYISEITQDGKKYYHLHFGPHEDYPLEIEAEEFDTYKMMYGVKSDQLMIVDDVVVDRNSQQKVFLLDGPDHFILADYYERITKRLYETLVEQDNRPKHSKPISPSEDIK